MSAFEIISKRIESFRNDMVDFQMKLSSYPAISPSSGGRGEAEKAAVLLDFIQKNGYEDVSFIKVPDFDVPSGYRPNIIARYKGKDSLRTIWIVSHMDVVPPGELAHWTGNPFKPWVEEGKIFGRGVEDNQQDMVASLYALKSFQEEGIRPVHDVGIVLVADEETGSKKGIHHIMEHCSPFRKGDMIIAPDAGNSDGTMIEVAEKSILWLRIKTLGVQTHGSTPEKGVNSLRAASHLIVELKKLYEEFSRTDPIFDPPISTFEPTMHESNVPNINTIPGEDVFSMDCRILPDYNLDEIRKSVREKASQIEEICRVRIEIEEVEAQPAAPATPSDSQVVKLLQRGIKRVYGVDARPVGIGGGTVAAHFRRMGYETACWSRTDETGHQPDEYSIIDNMVGDAKVFAHLFLEP